MSEYSDTESQRQWVCCGEKLPRDEIVYFCQIIAIYILIIACLVNLTLGIKPVEIYISLLSACIGYILPSPQIKTVKTRKNNYHNERNERFLPGTPLEQQTV